MEERKQGRSKLMYDKTAQAIVVVSTAEKRIAELEAENAKLRGMTKHPDQWTLGQLIDALEKAKPTSVYHGYAALYIDQIRSYRGFYEDLAIGATGEWSEGCSDGHAFLDYVKGCLGREFDGYKGGEYTATRDTPLWISNWGKSSDTIVTGLYVDDEIAYILGKWIGGAA